MATNSKNAATAETVQEHEEAPKVPHQTEAKVTSIKKGSEPVFDDEELTESIVSKAKRLVKDKRVVAGAATVALLTVGVFVARKRNSVEETDETPEA